MNSKKQLPVLKAASNKLFALLRCAYAHPFDRDSLREAVLRLYPGRDEKSVFRGMVIPTLRRLGLIIGYEQSIRLSANGTLIVTALDRSESEGLRALRCVLLEIDQATARFVDELERIGLMAVEQFMDAEVLTIEGPSRKQTLERIRDWIAYLSYAGLISIQDKSVEINLDDVRQTRADLDVSGKHDYFKNFLFAGYSILAQGQPGLRSVDIEELREKVAVLAYRDKSSIITKDQFDILLRSMSHITNEYVITFGRSMGPEENLFVLDDNYYETISIRFNKEHLT